jgi:hypothetical protein
MLSVVGLGSGVALIVEWAGRLTVIGDTFRGHDVRVRWSTDDKRMTSARSEPLDRSRRLR